MTPPGIVSVTGPGGLHGTIDTATWPLDGSRSHVLVQIDNREPVLVPFEALIRQEDGSYHLPLDPVTLGHQHGAASRPGEPPLVVPVIQEALNVETRAVETGRVRLHKVVREHEEVVDPPLWREEVVIERVPVNRIVEATVAARSEGDTVIIPLLEEVLVVEKRLLLKEEVHLTRRRVEIHQPQRVTLRREEVIVERVGPEGGEQPASPQEDTHGEDDHRSV